MKKTTKKTAKPKKVRKKTPKATVERVQKEFDHKCAICGNHTTQIHHIDEDPTNNSILNLIPLCPNHHLGDVHNPTKKIDKEIFSLFRKYKDPSILAPQFKPLYDRVQVFFNTNTQEENRILLNDLLSFVSQFNLGTYYSDRIFRILDPHAGLKLEYVEDLWTFSSELGVTVQSFEEEKRLYLMGLRKKKRKEPICHGSDKFEPAPIIKLTDIHKEMIEGTIVELLIYQDWVKDSPVKPKESTLAK